MLASLRLVHVSNCSTPEILVHVNSFSFSNEFTSVFHILGSFDSALIKFLVLIIVSIEFCYINTMLK